MSTIKNIQNWGDKHHPAWLDLFRIILGIVLIWKGVSFWTGIEAFNSLMRGAHLGAAVSISILAHLIIFAHIVGGAAIAIGTYTRTFCLINLPILIGAVFFINISHGIFRPYTEFWVSLSVLIGLICFIIEGNGKVAVDSDNSE
ncbi:DoxX family protein [Pedobacter aquatilis]|uniref:DoxX family protein n=1 Tax=Pedobacter aquatilis TaxID=351343 RepID=UPI00292E53D1|nr:DoxX family protein [Pedobacter aquatilis]